MSDLVKAVTEKPVYHVFKSVIRKQCYLVRKNWSVTLVITVHSVITVYQIFHAPAVDYQKQYQ